MLLPSDVKVHKNTPIYPGSNFTWGEATKNCTRVPQDLIINGKLIIDGLNIEQNIVDTARKMDEYRAKLGNVPIKINSWYRPSSVNVRVGGSKYSRHQFGDATDWVSDYFAPSQIARILEGNHNQGGYKAYRNFTHTDWRGNKARW